MKTPLDSVACLREVSLDELQEIRGGGLLGPLKDALGEFIDETVHCIVYEWDSLQECFRTGMREAEG